MSLAQVSARIAKGPLAQMGLMDRAACDRAAEVLAQVEKAGLETVRVVFADPHGVLRGKTIVASALESVFLRGLMVPSTLMLKDTSQRTVPPVWQGTGPMQGAGDILLLPDAATFRVLPWAPHSAWLMCDPRAKEGGPLPFAPRGMLRDAVARLADVGYAMQVGLEVEFHVFERVDAAREHADAQMPPRAPITRNLSPGWQFLSDTHYAQLEPIMDDLRRVAVGLGMAVRSTEVEMGPSQFEFTFDPSDPMQHADNMVMFRHAVQQVCAAKGLHATFMCKPVVANAAASGWHLHQSLQGLKDGRAVFLPKEGGLTATASAWIAGLLAHAQASCLLSTPTVNGYKRYQPHQLAPQNVLWGRDNRGAMLRAIMADGDPASRVENRVAEPAANPYLFFASQIISGMDGLSRGLEAPSASEDPYGAGAAQRLPANLGAAITAFDGSPLYRKVWGDSAVEHLVTLKKAEWERYLNALSAWEQDEYFSLY